MHFRLSLALLCVAAGAVPAWLVASSVSGLSVFSNGTVADADKVNANFDALADAVNDNDARIRVRSIQRKVGYGEQTSIGAVNSDPANPTHRAIDAVKTRADTSLRITWSDNFRTMSGLGRARWEIRVNGQGCTDPGPINQQITSHSANNTNGDNHHRQDTLIGYCKAAGGVALGAGTHRITVFTHPGLTTSEAPSAPYLGWSGRDASGSGSQFVFEVEEVE